MKTRMFSVVLVVCAALLCGQVGSFAQGACAFPDFSSTAGLSLAGSAARAGTSLRLTPATGWQAGAAWCTAKPNVRDGFETVFLFRISDPRNGGADGIAFVIQNSGAGALGTAGGNMGYGGIPNSVAVEFDTWQNGEFGDPNANHVSVQTHGYEANTPNHAYSLVTTSNIPNLSDGNIHVAKVRYAPPFLEVYVDDLAMPVATAHMDIGSLLILD